MDIAIVVIADPDNAEQVGGEAGEPAIMRGAGFSGRGGGEAPGPDSDRGTVIEHAFHHGSDYVRDARIKHLGLLRLVIVQNVAVGVTHGAKHDGRDALAVVGEDGVSRGHLHGRGVIRSQGHGGRGFYGRDTGGPGQGGNLVIAHHLGDFDGGVVERERQRLLQFNYGFCGLASCVVHTAE